MSFPSTPDTPGPHAHAPLPDDLLARAAAGDVVALTQVLVRTPSVNPELEPGGAGERAVAEQCARWLQAWGFEVAVSEPAHGRFNVLARMGTGPRRLLLNGHLDTVGVAGMDDPFSGSVHDGLLHGRGACDMKGGVAAILAAAAALACEPPAESGSGSEPDRQKARPEGSWREGAELLVALTADEEHASVGMQALVEAGIEADAAVVCEPTDLQVMPAHKGFAWVEIDFRGRAAHGSRPAAGVDAIRHAGLFLSALDGYEAALDTADPHPLLGRGSVHAGTISGGVAPSVYPDACRLVIERRTLPGEAMERVMEEVRAVLERVRKATPAVDAELRLGLHRHGTEVAEDAPLVRGLLAAVKSAGAKPRVDGMSAWVDAALLNASGIPAVCFGPGSILNAHGVEEWVPVAELETAARALELFTRDFAGKAR